ncbi:antibiotic biosynthesis monooxygenase [Shimia sp. R10_1]|uniref:putative quinol monooxygenase n=1 Tax=Shimia sp. R10_1 TaxID=2821095 RepID=UPI001ADACCF1|nr:antibiotic biosynthesis monooxygenase [Shimia sp. R10_1]MBO9475850.1 antibiotic biosynthesis monooxygenase [Shimia sp. R10_1]
MSVTVLLTFVVTTDDTSAFRETISELAKRVQCMPGALRYAVYQGADDPDYFHVHQVWANRGCYQAYINSTEAAAAFASLRGIVSELLVKELTPVANSDSTPVLVAV